MYNQLEIRKSYSSALALAVLFSLGTFLSYTFLRGFQGYPIHVLVNVKALALFILLAFQISSIQKFSSIRLLYKQLLSIGVLFEPLLALFSVSLAWIVISSLSYLALHISGYKCSFKITKLGFILIILFSLFLLIVLNTYYSHFSGYALPLYTEELLASGFLYKDYFYQTSITAMIKNYGEVSTGVHGLNEINSHTLSNFWYASLANILGTSALLSHVIAKFIILIPLFFLVLFLNINLSNRVLSDSRLVLLLVLLILQILLTTSMSMSMYYSETYLFAVIVTGLFLPILFNKQTNSYNIESLIFAGLIIVLLVFLKVQLALYIAVLFTYGVFKFAKFRFKNYLIISIFCLLTVLAWFLLKNDLLEYLSDLRFGIFPILFPETAYFFITPIIYLLFTYKFSLEAKNNPAHHFLLAGLIFTVLFFLFRNIADGHGHFFTIFLYLQLVLIIVCHNWLKISKSVLNLNLFRKVSLFTAVVVLATVCWRGTVLISEHIRLASIVAVQNKGIATQIFSKLDKTLTNSSPDALYYIGPEQKLLWTLVDDCSAKPFLLPAAFERARIFGLPPADLCRFYRLGYGYPSIGDKRAVNMSDTELCQNAIQLKFSSVSAITYNSKDGVQLKPIKCLES